jgi:hypothetical protein
VEYWNYRKRRWIVEVEKAEVSYGCSTKENNVYCWVYWLKRRWIVEVAKAEVSYGCSTKENNVYCWVFWLNCCKHRAVFTSTTVVEVNKELALSECTRVSSMKSDPA